MGAVIKLRCAATQPAKYPEFDASRNAVLVALSNLVAAGSMPEADLREELFGLQNGLRLLLESALIP